MESPPASITVSERTRRETMRFTLKWTIEHLKTLQDDTDVLFSNGISVEELGEEKEYQGRWRIATKPCHKTVETNTETRHISVHLCLTDVDPESRSYTGEHKLHVECSARVTTGRLGDTPVCYGSFERVYSSTSPGHGWHKFVEHIYLFGSEKQVGLVKDDCITITMDVLRYKNLKTVRIPPVTQTPSPVSHGGLERYREFAQQQLRVLQADYHYQTADFVLRSSDDKEFRVDRVLLMAQSPVFAAMLTHDSKEKQLSGFDLDDVDGETVEILVDFIYGCDVVKITSHNAEKVLIMADKYKMPSLLGICETVLASSVPAEKAVHYLVLASQRGLDLLRNTALRVVPKNMGRVLKEGGVQEALNGDPEIIHLMVEHGSKRIRLVGDEGKDACF